MKVRIPTEAGWIPGLVLADRWIYDSELIETTDSQQEYFRTTAAKPIHLANFEGDYSIVPEGHIFQVIAHMVRVVTDGDDPLNTRLTVIDTAELFNQGYFDWRIQGSTTDENALYYVCGGFDWRIIYEPSHAGTDDTVFMGDGTRANSRRYSVEKYIPGGRSIKYYLYWPGGIILGTSRKVQVAFYGHEVMLQA